MNRKKLLSPLAFIIYFALSYYFCNIILAHTHGMKDWSNLLAAVSFIVLIIALIFKKKFIALMSVVGYSGGYLIGLIFNSDGVDPGGGTTNNFWLIWTAVVIVSIIAGPVIEFIVALIQVNKN